jgi:hypothetical protein
MTSSGAYAVAGGMYDACSVYILCLYEDRTRPPSLCSFNLPHLASRNSKVAEITHPFRMQIAPINAACHIIIIAQQHHPHLL